MQQLHYCWEFKHFKKPRIYLHKDCELRVMHSYHQSEDTWFGVAIAPIPEGVTRKKVIKALGFKPDVLKPSYDERNAIALAKNGTSFFDNSDYWSMSESEAKAQLESIGLISKNNAVDAEVIDEDKCSQ